MPGPDESNDRIRFNDDFQKSFTHSRTRPPQPPPSSRPQQQPASNTQEPSAQTGPQNAGSD